MDLLLWRHAEAVDGTPDHLRELPARGQKQAAKVAAPTLNPKNFKKSLRLVLPSSRFSLSSKFPVASGMNSFSINA